MSDHNRQYDLDDELLSAYIDDELSPEERAAVEARLASDPAAQQLLHELRSVSQSVQAVPTEKLKRDLSDSVIAAITAKKTGGDAAGAVRGSPDPAPPSDRRSPSTTEKDTSADDEMPRLRIFGSKRAFVWAAMALAACLLIMFLQPGDNSKKLPQVAATNRGEAVDEALQQPRRELAISAAPKSEASKAEPPLAPPVGSVAGNEQQLRPAAPVAAEPAGSSGTLETNGRFAGGPGDRASAGAPALAPAANVPLAASSPAMRLRKEEADVSQLRDDVNAVTDQPNPRQMAAEKSSDAFKSFGNSTESASLGITDARRKAETNTDAGAQPFVLVRVVAKPDAIKNGSFDRVLAANNIAFVSESNMKQPASLDGGKVLKEMKSRSADKSNKSADSRTSDAVLVEAPPATIEMCLNDLNKNSSDFVSIAVSGPLQTADRFDVKAAPAKQIADTTKNLGQFSRGVVPEAQKDSIRLYEYYNGINLSPEPAAQDELRAGGGALGGNAQSVQISGGEGAPGLAGPAGPGLRRGPGGDASGATAAISGTQHDAKDGESWYFKEHQLPEIRRARRIESTTLDATAPAPQAQSQSRAARPRAESETLMEKPTSKRVPAEAAEAKADASNENLKVLFVFTPEAAPAPSAPTANPSKSAGK